MSRIRFSARDIDDAGSTTTACAVLPLFTGARLSGSARDLDKACDGGISAALKLGDFSGKAGESLLLPGGGGAKRVLLLGCGEAGKFNLAGARKLCDKAVSAVNATTAANALFYASQLKLKSRDLPVTLSYLARTFTAASYRYTATVSKPRPEGKLRRVVVAVAGGSAVKAAGRALAQGRATGLGMNVAKDLANLPGNFCTPTHLAQAARKFGRGKDKVRVTVLDEKKMRELGMGSLLSVSAGSREPAKLITMQYSGGKRGAQPHVLVGKGITFDSGGISLKPGAKMDEMKYDMGGAASVFGALAAAVELKLPINIVGIVAAAENMPSSTATKPGDVVTSMSGKTIEVLNTDAEGRLVLCDALTYAARYKPESIIDIATLTGACIVALGSHASGLFANTDELAEQLLAAGEESHDRAWRLPLWDDYQDMLKSNFADIPNIGGPGAGTITAACFLSRFCEDYNWAHLDIAGSAWNSAPKGATGRPVALLTQYLIDRAGRAL
ncbi:MAG: leucyl aminopeptidase [Halioglobus sp.]|nr:leucyl aminopeptidase [Halioglobus sp.]